MLQPWTIQHPYLQQIQNGSSPLLEPSFTTVKHLYQVLTLLLMIFPFPKLSLLRLQKTNVYGRWIMLPLIQMPISVFMLVT